MGFESALYLIISGASAAAQHEQGRKAQSTQKSTAKKQAEAAMRAKPKQQWSQTASDTRRRRRAVARGSIMAPGGTLG